MTRIADILLKVRKFPKGWITALLLATLAVAAFIDTGFGPSVAYVNETGEELYASADSPLAMVFDRLVADAPGGIPVAANRAIHLATMARFVGAVVPRVADNTVTVDNSLRRAQPDASMLDSGINGDKSLRDDRPAADDYLVRLYMFTSELIGEYEKRRVDPAYLYRALDAIGTAMRTRIEAADEPAEAEPAIADVEPLPEPAPEFVVIPKPAPTKSVAKKAPAATPAPEADEEDLALDEPVAKHRGDRASLVRDEIRTIHDFERQGDRIVESLSYDLGFLME